MMRKKVVFTRDPACAPFFFQGYSQNLIFNHIENLENLDPVQYGKSMDTGAIQYEALWTCLFQGSSFNKQTVNVYIF